MDNPKTHTTDADVDLARSNLMACAYNAAVNHGSERGVRKMADLVGAINHFERTRGRRKMERLVELGIITEWKPCSPECCVRPGGLFHAKGCENDMNHEVYRMRTDLAAMNLAPKDGGRDAACVMLVGGGA